MNQFLVSVWLSFLSRKLDCLCFLDGFDRALLVLCLTLATRGLGFLSPPANFRNILLNARMRLLVLRADTDVPPGRMSNRDCQDDVTIFLASSSDSD